MEAAEYENVYLTTLSIKKEICYPIYYRKSVKENLKKGNICLLMQAVFFEI